MLLVLSVRLASTIHYYLQAFAPTNIVLRNLRTRGALKWAIPAGLLLVPTYLFAAAITTAVIADGGPGWLNLVALTCIWNAMKFVWMGVLSVPLLAHALVCERRVVHYYDLKGAAISRLPRQIGRTRVSGFAP